MQAQATAFKNF